MTTDANGALVAAKEAPNPNVPLLVLLVFIQVIYVCMIYGPIAAYLVEAFPAKIRYTSLSLPYHIGNGVFGGLVPLIGLSVCAATGNIYAGLYYPMIVASITLVLGSILLKETYGHKIWDEVGHEVALLHISTRARDALTLAPAWEHHFWRANSFCRGNESA